MVLRRGELGQPILSRLRDTELKELLGFPIVEPVHDPARNHAVSLRIVREDLDVHPLVDDLSYLFLGAVGQGDPGRVCHASEHDSYLFPQLVNENCGGLGLAQRAGDLAERLGHEPGLEPDVAVPHLALDLRLRNERGDRVDDHDVDGSGADKHVRDLQRLLAGVRLGNQQPVGVDAEFLGVIRVKRVLGVDKRGDSTRLLCVRHGMQRHGRVVGEYAVGYETVGVGEDHIEGRLKSSVLDRDDLLVGIRKSREHPQVLHDRLGPCREPAFLAITPLDDLHQALPRA